MNRRSLILGAVALISAPAIVRAESLMKLYVPRKPTVEELVQRMLLDRQVRLQAAMEMHIFGTSFVEQDADGFAVRVVDPADLRVDTPNHSVESYSLRLGGYGEHYGLRA